MTHTTARRFFSFIFINLIFSLVSTDMIQAETLSVNRFSDMPSDLSAVNNQVKDLKGKPCALLKVWGTDNLTGIVGNNMGAISRRGDETWINLVDGTDKITLTFSDCDTLLIYTKDFGIDNLKSQSTYLLTFSEDQIEDQEKDPKPGYSDFRNGIDHFYGISSRQDLKKARQEFIKAAEKGNTGAQYYLGMMYLNGIGIDKDANLAFDWFSAASRRNHPDAMLELARIYQNDKSPKYDDEMAFAFFNKSADAGNATAMSEVGYYYNNGIYIAKDEAKALQLFIKAAEGGDTMGQHNLGLRYYKGDGVPKDRKKAFELFNKAAAAGDPFDLFNVGNMYERGVGVEKDMNKALDYYHRAKAQGNDKAISALLLLGIE